VLLAGLTALEMMMFAARLSLPRGTSGAERRARVEEVLTMLHLSEDNARTKIGSVDSRGLSGGQRKRVSIGVELLADPAVLLLDEPTSGLDAKMALDVGAILRALALAGRTVICTVHQPSYRLFSTFDTLLLLADGRLAYNGPTAEAVNHFGALGHPTPAHENPAEELLTLLDEPRRVTRLCDAWASHTRRDQPSTAAAAAAVANGDPSHDCDAPRPRHLGDGAAPQRFPVSPGAQVCVLAYRQLSDAIKDPKKLPQSVLLRLAVGLVIGVLFINQGRSDDYTSIFPTTSSMFIACFSCNLDVLLESLLEVPQRRALLKREYTNGLYSCEAYFAASILVHAMVAVCTSAALVVPLYFLVGFAATPTKFLVFLAAQALMSGVGLAIGMLVGALSRDLDEAKNLTMPILAPMMVFSGYVLPYNSIPSYFKPFYYASFWQYCLGILQINEFSGRVYTEKCPTTLIEQTIYDDIRDLIVADIDPYLRPWLLNGTGNLTLPSRHFEGECYGDTFLQMTNLLPVQFGGLWGYFLILVGFLLGFLLAAYCALKFSLRSAMLVS